MIAADFNSVVLGHSEFLRPYAISLTRNPEDANDLFQETMMRALLNREKYQLGTNLKAWLYTIMRNIFINNYHRSRRFTKVESDTPPELFMYQAGKVAINDGWTHIRMGEIRTAVDALPPVFRTAFDLYYTGYKYQEIADLLEEPLGTIKSRIHFARKTLVTQLER